MKKMLSMLLALTMVLSVPFAASAAAQTQEPRTPEVEILTGDPVDTGITPYTQTLQFNLKPGEYTLSKDEHYIEGEDTLLVINSATWDPPTENIRIGFRDVKTGTGYYLAFTGGKVTGETMNSNGIPNGRYQIYVKNMGEETVIGALNYDVDMK